MINLDRWFNECIETFITAISPFTYFMDVHKSLPASVELKKVTGSSLSMLRRSMTRIRENIQ